jgi:hypothetical protein
MHTKFILVFTLIMIINQSVAFSEDIMVQSLSQGACWFESGELLKLSSFNDKETLLTSKEEIDSTLDEMLNSKQKSRNRSSEVMLHCGGYGSSLIVKTKVNDRAACVWLRVEKGELKIRSVGGLENTKGDLCDGYKWGELIVGIKNSEQLEALKSESFRPLVKSVMAISKSTLKIVLNEDYIGRENEAMLEIKKQLDLKYVELNFYQHPVGEVAVLK